MPLMPTPEMNRRLDSKDIRKLFKRDPEKALDIVDRGIRELRQERQVLLGRIGALKGRK